MRGHWIVDFRQYNMTVNHIMCFLVLFVSGVLTLDIDSEDVTKQVTVSVNKCVSVYVWKSL